MDGRDHSAARQVAAEPLGMSSGHAPVQCPQGRSCSDLCGESALSCQSRLDTWWPDCTPRAMRVIQQYPPVAIRPPHHDRAVSPAHRGTCRALAGAVNWSKSCPWTPLFLEFPDFLLPFAPFCLFRRLKAAQQTQRRLRKGHSDMIRRRPLAHPHRRAQPGIDYYEEGLEPGTSLQHLDLPAPVKHCLLPLSLSQIPAPRTQPRDATFLASSP